ncbi:undecaprenyl-diphosphate phosphatase [Methanobacterium oryzae]|uniref:undecaprenyl-diphosphate phosphatase n=1 Tax=Methanobacterium oryzae TaxID=69540 RepID=UPI003D206C09
MDITNILIGIIIGLVQGLTEFLPVSSSAHLVFMHELTGFAPNLAFDTILHIGSLVAVLMYFWNDIIHMLMAFFSSLMDIPRGQFKKGIKEDQFKKLAWFIIIGSIPAGLAGVFLKDFFESLFSNITAVGFFLIITGFLLWGSEKVSQRIPKKTGLKEMTVKNSLIMGTAQAFAIAPGISRSGATISAGLFLGLERELAARFSFLLSIPAILGAALVQIKDISYGIDVNTGAFVAGFIAAAISGYLAIKLMLKLIKERNLLIFAYYCWIIGGIVLILQSVF